MKVCPTLQSKRGIASERASKTVVSKTLDEISYLPKNVKLQFSVIFVSGDFED